MIRYGRTHLFKKFIKKEKMSFLKEITSSKVINTSLRTNPICTKKFCGNKVDVRPGKKWQNVTIGTEKCY